MPRIVLTLLAALAAGAVLVPAAAAAGSSDLFFSEYVEGTSNNKALEIYNGTGATVSLAGHYAIKQYSNGATSAGLTINLTGSIAPGDVYVVAHSSAAAAILAEADQTTGAGLFNGNDALELVKDGATVDVIGQIGFDPGAAGWGTDPTNTTDNTIRRKASIHDGDTNGSDPFDPAAEWEGFATNTFDGLGSHTVDDGDAAPTVTSVSPADGDVAVEADADVTVTFSEPVAVSGSWYSLLCTTTGVHTGTVAGGPTSFTIAPATDFAVGESCTLTVHGANVSDLDAIDPPDTMGGDASSSFSTSNPCVQSYTAVPAIQGSGEISPMAGQTVTTEGVVVGDYEGASPALRGFYLQDAAGDGDTSTSDGVFVFHGNSDTVSVGDVVRVTGAVSEFQGQTQISSSKVVACGTGSVAPVDVTLPVPSADFLERYEGMLVRMPQTLYVTEHFQLGRFGQVVMSSGDRLYQPTSLVAPGAAAAALQAQNDLNRIIVDDATNRQNPDPILFGRGGDPLSASNTLRGGDTATGIVGVLTYTWAGNSASGNAYRVRPVGALGGGVPDFVPANPRPAAAPAVGGSLKVAGMNLLNFFDTFGSTACSGGVGGETMECRGADNASEFDRQWPKTVAAVVGTGADVIGVVEMENDGYGPDSAIAFLVSKLNEATAPGTYAYVDVDAATGQVNALGTDAIKVGVLYKPARATPVGATAALNSVAFVNGGDSEPRNRPALAQAFRENATGETFVVSVNHLKSKGSACDAPDTGDGQGNCAGVRTNAANLLAEWLASDPTGTGAADRTLIVGDLNSYAKEDPIAALESHGFENLVAATIGDDAYSYVFDGQWGYLDHAIGTAGLARDVAGVGEWHIDADEPSVLDYNVDFKSAGQRTSLYAPDQFRISDHDPVLVGLDLHATVEGLCTLTRQLVTKNDGLRISLCAKLQSGAFGAYANEVQAQAGKALTAAQAETLLARVRQLQ